MIRHRVVELNPGQSGIQKGCLKLPLHPGALLWVMSASCQKPKPYGILTCKYKAAMILQVFPGPAYDLSYISLLPRSAARPYEENPVKPALPVLQSIGNIGLVPVPFPVNGHIFIPAVHHRHMGTAVSQEPGERTVTGSYLQHLVMDREIQPLQKILPDRSQGMKHLRTVI